MIEFKYRGEELYARMERADALVKERLRRTVQVIEANAISYAVIGGFAVRAWVSQVDPAAVRGTPDVDVLIDRSDLDRLASTMSIAGFQFRTAQNSIRFVERVEQRDREAIDIHYVGELIPGNSIESLPDLANAQRLSGFNTVSLDTLIRMKLNAHRTVDRVHLQDMISLGMVDEAWLDRFPPVLSGRLKELLDDPNG